MILHFIGRVFVIGFSLLAALIAAGIVYAGAANATIDTPLSLGDTWPFGIAAGALFIFLAGAPAFVAAFIVELLGVRSWIIYAALGAIIALGSFTLVQLPIMDDVIREANWIDQTGFFYEFDLDLSQTLKDLFNSERAWLAIVASGLAGGLVYWVMAGRNAGYAIKLPGQDQAG